jgi:quinoprotein glucose dehydrogenase
MAWFAAIVEGGGTRRMYQEPEGRRSVWDGVYSEPQASRGLREYTRACERCHGPDLTGNATDEVPGLVADMFIFHWGGRTVQDLYDRVRKTMPADTPGSLDASAYLDIVAYLLEANGFPHGQQDLDRSRLSVIVIEKASSR